MALTDTSFKTISDIPDIGPYNAICMGPGMNEDEVAKYALKKLLNEVKVPLLLDAGALNILGKYRELLDIIPSNTILTPHPKEFERLTENFTNGFEKLEGLIAFSKKTKCIVVLKGAHTAIALPDGRVYFNSTGNPGMATGGSGDVLSGIITGLLAQAYNAEDAAILGVFLHGCAGDIAANSKSQHAMMASDIIDGIGGFYKEILIK